MNERTGISEKDAELSEIFELVCNIVVKAEVDISCSSSSSGSNLDVYESTAGCKESAAVCTELVSWEVSVASICVSNSCPIRKGKKIG